MRWSLLLLAGLGAGFWGEGRGVGQQEKDLGSQVRAADAALGTRAGVIRVATAGVLATPLTLGAGHALLIEAPVELRATVTLAGGNLIACAGASATITVAGGVTPIVARTRGNTVRDCTVRAQGGYLVDGAGSDGLQVLHNDVHEMGLVDTSRGPGAATTSFKIDGNASRFAKTVNGNAAGVYLFFAQNGTVTNNTFEGNTHGAEWWGGNSNGEWAGAEKVTRTTNLTFTGNNCHAIFQSCIWGSMGAHIAVTGNTADGCGDVCFDTEGGVDTVFASNVATGCGFACYAVFFESLNVSFTGNTGFGDPWGGMAVVKHPSGYGPTHRNVIWSGNIFTCLPKLCQAFYSEGQSGPVLFENNQVVDGVVAGVNYTGSTSFRGNHFLFTQTIGKGVALAPNAMVGGARIQVSDNWVESEVAQPEGTCLAFSWSDYNSTDTHFVERNHCAGFGVDLVAETAGRNPGVRALWVIRGNYFGSGVVRHVQTTGNEVYSFGPDNMKGDGSAMAVR